MYCKAETEKFVLRKNRKRVSESVNTRSCQWVKRDYKDRMKFEPNDQCT